jgi:alkylation response protein AidB-like acyl-CoA dehydrogenase
MERNCFEEEHNIFRESFRKFIEKEVAPFSEKWREEGIVPRDIWLKAGENGYLLTWADEQYGGLGIDDFRFEQIMIEELSRVGESGFYMNLHSALVAPYLDKFATDEQKQRFLPDCITGKTILGIAMTEPDAGSDLAGMRSSAKDCGDHFLLNGTKTFISNGINGDLFIIAAKTAADNPHAIGLFLVERGMEGFSRGKQLKKMGLPSQDTAELIFDNVKIPKENILGNPAKGFRYLMSGLAEERLITASSCIASAQTAFDLTINYVQERKAFGRPIAKFQNTRFKLAEMKTQIEVAQVFIDRCVSELNLKKLSAEDAAIAKLYTSELLGRVADECLQLHGGNGFMQEYLISRIYSDARVSRIFAGTSEIMKEIISRDILDD